MIFRKLIFSLFVLVFLFAVSFALSTPAFAQQTQKFDNTLDSYQQGLGGQRYNKQTFDFQSLIGTTGGLYTMLAGCKSASCPQSLRTGAIDYVNLAIASSYSQPPASGTYYFAEMGRNLHIIPQVYAQEGAGFRALDPFLNIWRATRNVVYVLFVILIAVLGLMIMFRQKISPQAVMTVQAALPRIIVALVMITFSYAIVGLLIDLMYLLFGLLVYALGTSGAPLADYNQATYFSKFTNAGFDTTTTHVVTRGISSSWDVFRGIFSADTSLSVGSGLLAAIATIAIAATTGAAGAIAVAAIPLLLGLIITFIGFLIKILFSLARAYLLLVIHLVFAPFFILWGAVTGTGIYQAWLKGVLSNLFVFFAVGVLIFIADVLIEQLGAASGTIWGPPYLGSNPALLQGMIGFGSIVLIAQLPDFVNQLFDVRGMRFDMPGMGRQIDQFSGMATQSYARTRESYLRPAQGQEATPLVKEWARNLRNRLPF